MGYAEGVRRSASDDVKLLQARHVVDVLLERQEMIVVPAQVIAELHHLLRRKAALSAVEASRRTDRWLAAALVVPTTVEILASMKILTAAHRLQTYDAIILSAAASVGCDTLYSEDMQAGFTWNGVRIVDPFA